MWGDFTLRNPKHFQKWAIALFHIYHTWMQVIRVGQRWLTNLPTNCLIPIVICCFNLENLITIIALKEPLTNLWACIWIIYTFIHAHVYAHKSKWWFFHTHIQSLHQFKYLIVILAFTNSLRFSFILYLSFPLPHKCRVLFVVHTHFLYTFWFYLFGIVWLWLLCSTVSSKVCVCVCVRVRVWSHSGISWAKSNRLIGIQMFRGFQSVCNMLAGNPI